MLLFASPTVFAEKKPSKKRVQKKSKKKLSKTDAAAKRAFIQGVRFFKAGEYDAALPLFRKAYEISGHRRSTVLALAQCERVLKMYDDAIAHYREYLAMDPPNAEKIRETVKLTQELLDTMGGTSKPERPPSKETSPDLIPSNKKDDGSVSTSEPDLSVKPKPPKNAGVTPIRAEVANAPQETASGSLNMWLWTIGSVIVVGGGAAAGYFLWPQPDAYGGSTGVIARPPGD
jgi:tetratricopeptide (TPR) repeat protein